MNDKPQSPPSQHININTTDEISRGRYSNEMIAMHSPEEFMLDWLLNSPNGHHLVARIILSPSNMKRTIETLKASLKQYEEKFGVVKIIEPDGQNVH